MYDRIDEEALNTFQARFERFYVRVNPKPKPSTSFWVKLLLGIIIVASVIVSSSHTVPAFLDALEKDPNSSTEGKALIAVASLIMVELALLTLVFLYVLWKGEASRKAVLTNIRRGIVVTFALTIGSNLHSVLEPRFGGSPEWDVITFVIFVTVAISAPSIAYITGEVLGMQTILDRAETKIAMDEWIATKREAWLKELAKFERRLGSRSPIAVEPPAAVPPAPAPRALPEPINLDDKPTVKKAVEWLLDPANAADAGLPLRRVAELAEVGKDAVAEARQWIKDNRPS